DLYFGSVSMVGHSARSTPRASNQKDGPPRRLTFHDEILRALRHEVSGVDDMTRDTKSVERLSVDSRLAQINILSSLEQAGLPDNLINPQEGVAENSFSAKKASE
ncbi:hypothetical protein ABIE69_002882, partial [Rhodobacteraceae bacterium MBR-64]